MEAWGSRASAHPCWCVLVGAAGRAAQSRHHGLEVLHECNSPAIHPREHMGREGSIRLCLCGMLRAPCHCPNTRLSWVPIQYSPEPKSFPLLGLAGSPIGTGVGGAATECHLTVPALGIEGDVGARRVSQHRVLLPLPCPTQQGTEVCREGGMVLQAASPGGMADPPHCPFPLCRDRSSHTGNP